MAGATSELLTWYSRINAKYLDLVGDYAGKERFFVEGDSLLLECFSNPQLDFNPGFEILHAVFLVEQFLHNLIRRGCVFDCVFFQQHEQLCLPPNQTHPSRYFLAREAIISHLRENATNINVLRFHSLEDDVFREYLENSAVYFALCSDGAKYAAKELHSLSLQTYADSKHEENENTDQRARLRGIIYRLEQLHLDVALLNGLEFQDSKVFAFVMEGASMYATKSDLITQEIASIEDTSSPSVAKYSNDGDQSDAIMEAGAVFRSGGLQDPSSRLLLTVATLRELAQDAAFVPLISACLTYALHLELTPLSARQTPNLNLGQKLEGLYSKFTDAFASICLQILSSLTSSVSVDASVADLFDGRLFRSILSDRASSTAALPESYQRVVLPGLLTIITGTKTDIEDDLEDLRIPLPPTPPEYDFETPTSSSILAFSHPAFDEHLSPININLATAADTRKRGGEKNLMKRAIKRKYPQTSNKSQPADARAQKKAMRSHQRFMAEMTAYAASLTNAQGKILRPELILVGEKTKQSSIPVRAAEAESRANPKSKQGGHQKKKAQSNVKDKIALATDQLNKKRDDATLTAWTRAREAIDQESNLVKKYALVVAYSNDVSLRKDLRAISNEIELYKVSVLVQIWADYCRKGLQSQGQHIAALIYDGLLRLSASPHMTKPISEAARNIALLCGMTIPRVEFSDGRPLSFQVPSIADVSLAIACDPLEFKLKQMGPYLDRAMEQDEDSRVSFKPDLWQRKVLDELDANRSILVVAPTSSGKTFISFYAMEKVLRSSNDGVIVYIAPTKALVNQIAAEIQARFNKNYEYAGTSVYAISSRDYKVNNPKQCQVLVTVPYILQNMLLAPSNKAWTPRIKTVILDEVHSIGQAEDGLVWEQLLLMAPCQVVALSATVGNPQAFASWLSSAQSAIGRSSEMIEHKSRFSDLRKYMFEPPASIEFSGLPEKPLLAPLGLEDLSDLKYLHPVCCLSHPQRGIPDDLELESRDCLLLWQAMKRFETSTYAMPDELSPSKFFSNATVIKLDVINWAIELKRVLSIWMQDRDSPFRAVITELSKDLPPSKAAAAVTNPPHKNEETPAQSDINELMEGTLPLMSKLHSANALPAIFFNFDRTACEDIINFVHKQLIETENRFKETDPAWKAKVAKFEIWQKATEAQKLAGKKDAMKKTKKATGEERDEQRSSAAGNDEGGTDSESSRFESFDPTMPLQQFSFADPKKADALELTKTLDKFKWAEVDERLIDAFQRGIAVHHAGLGRKYRQAVEIWFRRGFLTVVVATGTLSLGINMPCKTVVFSGDSVYLTALNFRQSAGRSGRRGFDLLGNVVFQNISTQKACRLLSSRLPNLSGHFPLTTNFVLRLLALLHGTNNAPYAMQMVNSLLSQPRLYLGGESFKHQVLHHVRFSIEYLRSEGLVSASGEPLNFARMAAHLANEENSAFAMHALLKAGYFHKLAEELHAHEELTLRTLVLTMANLFSRRSMRTVDTETQINNIKASSSVVFLPPLPKDAIEILRKHDERTLTTYITYVRTFVRQNITEPDETLPLTQVSIRPVKLNQFTPAPESQQKQIATRLRSPFVALSGHGDHFESISDLCGSVRDGVFLEKAVIPHLDMGEEIKAPLNAYIYDFYRHGDVEALITANRISRGDIWYFLNDFSLVLATVVASLESLLRNDDSGDLDMANIGALGDDIEQEMDAKEDAGDAEDDELVSANGSAIETKITRPTLSQPAEKSKKAKKKVVVDSWDDEDSGDDSGDSEDSDESLTAEEDAKLADQELKRLKMVFLMFKKLKTDFDTKFRKMWA